MKFNIKNSSILNYLCIAIIAFTILVFSINSLSLSGRKPFWLDEVHSLSNTVRKYSYKEMIVTGAVGQGSPSPLDYLIVKTVDHYKNTFNYFNLQPHQYFRVYNLIFLWLIVLLLSYLVYP